MDASRWDDLDDDLGGEGAAFEAAELYAQAAELARAELATLTLVERLRAEVGREVTVCVRGAAPVRGVLIEVGRDFLQLTDGPRETVVLLVAVLSVTRVGTRSGSAVVASPVTGRLGLGHVLRRHARDRSTLRIVLDTGDVVTGTADAVGADHVELAEHPAGSQRRAAAVVARRLVPFASIATVSRAQASLGANGCSLT